MRNSMVSPAVNAELFNFLNSKLSVLKLNKMKAKMKKLSLRLMGFMVSNDIPIVFKEYTENVSRIH